MVDFRTIHKVGTSQENGFEEFVCQLARKEKIPNAKEFVRLGNPDGGLECYWKCEDGSLIGWQAKFFTGSLSERNRWNQIKESIKSALKNYNFKKIIIAIPYDLGKVAREELAINVNNWYNLSEAKGKKFEIAFWWEHDLIAKLSKPENEGFRKFWFDELEFSDDWFSQNAEKTLNNLGDSLESESDIIRSQECYFNSIYQTNPFINYFFENIRHHLINCKHQINLLYSEMGVIGNEDFQEFSYQLKQSNMNVLSAIENDLLNKDFKHIEQLNTELYEKILYKMESNLEFLYNQLISEKELFEKICTQINKTCECLIEFHGFLSSNKVHLADNPYLIFSGKPNCGKTFLLSSVVKNKTNNGENVIFLLGKNFTSMSNPELIILEELGLTDYSFDDFLDALECKSYIKKSRIVIFIDGIEEGNGIDLWNNHFNGIFGKISKRRNIGLVISIRDNYLNDVTKENPKKLIISKNNYYKFVIENLNDFEDKIYSPIGFFELNGVDFINNYLLLPEFDNPQFLKVYFKLLKQEKLEKLPYSLSSYCDIIDGYLEKINEILAYKFNYYGENLVKQVLYDIIKLESQNISLNISNVNRVILTSLSLYPQFNYKFLEALINEGILVETRNHRINIGFPIFEDYLLTKLFFEEVTEEDLENQFHDDGKLFKLISTDGEISDTDLLRMFSIYVPETYGVELYELLEDNKCNKEVIYSFLNSLKWRNDFDVEKTLKFINEHVIGDIVLYKKLFRELIVLASIEKHPFNAHVLHEFLFNMSLADRDAIWTSLINEDYFPEYRFIKQLLKLPKFNDFSNYCDETIKLTSILLTWLLTTYKGSLRDDVSQSLIHILKNNIPILLELLELFEGVNDDFVYERLFAIAYGCTTLTEDEESLKKLAIYVYDLIFNQDEVYPNVLLRDYARCILEYALNNGLDLDGEIDADRINPPYSSQFPPIPTQQEMDAYQSDDIPTKHIFKTVKGQYSTNIVPMEYFGCHTLTATFALWEKQLLNDHICLIDLFNMIIKKVFDLGYDAEKHGKIDEKFLKNNNSLESICGKYQWISYYQLVAQLMDRYPITFNQFLEYEKTTFGLNPWTVQLRRFDPTINYSPIVHKIGLSVFDEFYRDSLLNNQLQNSDATPDLKSIIDFNISVNGKDFNGILLEGNYNWDYNDYSKNTSDNRLPILQIRSYFIPKEEYPNFLNVLQNKMLRTHDFFDSKGFYEIYNKEYYHSQCFKIYNQYEKINNLTVIDYENNRYHLSYSTIFPVFTKFRNHKEFFLKCDSDLYDYFDLEYGIENSFLYSQNDEIVSFDTNEVNSKDHNLIFDKSMLLDYLDANDLEIIFTAKLCKNDNLFTGIYYFENNHLCGELIPYSEICLGNDFIVFKGIVNKIENGRNYDRYYLDENNLISYVFTSKAITNSDFDGKELIRSNYRTNNVVSDIYFISEENKIDEDYYNFVKCNLGDYKDNYLLNIKTDNCNLVLLVNSANMEVRNNLRPKIFKEYVLPLLEQINFFEFIDYDDEPDEIWEHYEYLWRDAVQNNS